MIQAGKIYFCAINEMPVEGFTESEISEKMAEHGWNIGHSSLAPGLGGLASDGDLIKIDGSRPARYRLPRKVKVNIVKE